MSKILITGATGNVGLEVVKYLCRLSVTNEDAVPTWIIGGVRNIEKSAAVFRDYPCLSLVRFDFEDPGTFDKALIGIDRVFLLRPPHISDVDKYFRPLISSIKNKGINQIVFLSVQGAEKSKVIPHNKSYLCSNFKNNGTHNQCSKPQNKEPCSSSGEVARAQETESCCC